MSTEVKNATLVCKIYIMAEKSDFNKILCQKKYLLYISIAFKKKKKRKYFSKLGGYLTNSKNKQKTY